MSQYNTSPGMGNTAGNTGPSEIDVNTIVNTPTDRVRWGPIIAGLFAALSTLAVLSVLGLAIGLSAYDPGDDARRFGIGAGIWGAISMLIAFFFGGWLAARAAAVRGERNGLLNGSLVWAVAIPLMLFLLGGGLSNMVGRSQMSDDEVRTVIRASAGNDNQGGAVVTDPNANRAYSGNTSANTSGNTTEETKTARRAAWGTLLSLLLGLGAASLGGYLGSRDRYPDGDRHRGHDRGAPAV